MKKFILAILLILPTMAFAQKFGTVDATTIIPNLPEYKEAQTAVEAAAKTLETELANLNEQYQKAIEAFQALPKDELESIKQRKAEEIQTLEQRIMQFRQSASQDLDQQQQKLMAPILQKVNDAINAVVAEGGYTMVFERSAGIYPGAAVEDITPAVKKKLNIL